MPAPATYRVGLRAGSGRSDDPADAPGGVWVACTLLAARVRRVARILPLVAHGRGNPEQEADVRALAYHGPGDVRVEWKEDPRIEHPGDVILRVTRAAICGSDLHLYRGLVPDTRVGHTFGHEFTGVVVEAGPGVRSLEPGDRVVVPFNIACGTCFFCRRELFSMCENTNPSSAALGGVYGYSHTAGGYDGGQAEYVRVPFADVGPLKIPDDLEDEDVLLLYPVHPNPQVRGPAAELLADHPRIRLTDPLDYLDLLYALRRATLVLTDSGGIQEEAPSFGTPVLVLRDVTERPEGIEAGVARLVGTAPARILEAADELLRDEAARARMARAANPYGDGRAAERIADIVVHALTGRPRRTEDWEGAA